MKNSPYTLIEQSLNYIVMSIQAPGCSVVVCSTVQFDVMM